MHRLPIFEGLEMPADAAKELAAYWRAAGDAVGIINAKGHLETPENLWKRPLSDTSFKVLKEALKESDVSWIEVQEDQIKVDFSKLHYNVEWLKEIVQKYNLGVSNCRYGLLVFVPRKANGDIWYDQQPWELTKVTVEDLGFTHHEISPTDSNMKNPRTADWRNLYFAD